MIIYKGRRDCKLYEDSHLNQTCILKQFSSQNQKKNYLHKQRYSIGGLTPTNRNRNDFNNTNEKNFNKRYDYSVHLENSLQKSFDNMICANRIDFVKQKQKLRCFSVSNYKTNDKRSQIKQSPLIQKSEKFRNYREKQLNQEDLCYKQINKKNEYQFMSSISKKRESFQYLNKDNKQNQFLQGNRSIGTNNLYDNIRFPQKFLKNECSGKSQGLKQILMNNMIGNINKEKYQTKYMKMRSKHCQVVLRQEKQKQKVMIDRRELRKQKIMQLKEKQGENKIKKQVRQKERQGKNEKVQKWRKVEEIKEKEDMMKEKQQIEREGKPFSMGRQEILKGSEQQNAKIRQKITKLEGLNRQIKEKLQKMLRKNTNF